MKTRLDQALDLCDHDICRFEHALPSNSCGGIIVDTITDNSQRTKCVCRSEKRQGAFFMSPGVNRLGLLTWLNRLRCVDQDKC